MEVALIMVDDTAILQGARVCGIVILQSFLEQCVCLAIGADTRDTIRQSSDFVNECEIAFKMEGVRGCYGERIDTD